MKREEVFDGELKLNKGYSIVRVLYHSMGEQYTPYIVGCILEGPKGGKYLIDNFGIQYLFRYYNIRVQQGTVCKLLDSNGNVKVTSTCLMRDKDIIKGKTNEECAATYARANGYKYIKRSEVLAFIDKIRK